jgi:hypothetical protein
MPEKPTSQFGVSPAIASLRRFVVRYLQPFLVRPFEGAPEERPLADGLKQIAGTLRAVGVLPEDSIVKQIGSEFRLLFCATDPAATTKSQPSDRLTDPVKSISDMLRKPPGRSVAPAALRRFAALCKGAILSRSRRSFL